MNGTPSIDGDAQLAEQETKPVAEFWCAIQPQGDGIIRFSEIYVHPYAVGDIWFACETEENSLVSKHLTDGTPPALSRAEARLYAHRS